ncbi:hypothetical protein HK097_007090 [Rhizophlyctis rosea]|uniref:G-protein coupled receptors family 1 profile domain-containing protein n=1 Tax=Rhizophlyctis rosea TaxID=64517 RepID=A0AAD5X657_9FUNG|nr:hypothetical protein HK097_007090 [Rhizophlyctis rosea]
MTAISPFWFKDNIYELRSSGVLCLANWAHRSTHGKAFTAWTLLALTIAIIIILFSYYSVLREIRRARKALSSTVRPNMEMVVDLSVGEPQYSGLRLSGGSEQRGSWKESRPSGMFGSDGSGLGGSARIGGRGIPVKKGKSKRELEAKVALRSVIIVGVFLLEWAPLGSVFVVEFFTGRAVSPLYDYISKFLANTNFVCNAVLFMILDRRFSRRVRTLLSSLLATIFPCLQSSSKSSKRRATVDELMLDDDEEMGIVVRPGSASVGRSVTNTSMGSGVIGLDDMLRGTSSLARPAVPSRHLDIENIRHGGNSPGRGRG